jgi:hypothetical protein
MPKCNTKLLARIEIIFLLHNPEHGANQLFFCYSRIQKSIHHSFNFNFLNLAKFLIVLIILKMNHYLKYLKLYQGFKFDFASVNFVFCYLNFYF